MDRRARDRVKHETAMRTAHGDPELAKQILGIDEIAKQIREKLNIDINDSATIMAMVVAAVDMTTERCFKNKSLDRLPYRISLLKNIIEPSKEARLLELGWDAKLDH